MYYRKLVEQAYQEAIALNKNIPADLRDSLRRHNRMPLFLSNLALELEKAQTSTLARGRSKIADNRLKEIVYDFTEVFIQGIKAEADRRYQSDIQKKLIEAEATRRADLEKTASGNVSGEYQELFEQGGISVTDERTET